MTFITDIKKKRSGILLGLLAGLLFTGYLAATGADLSFAMETTKLDVSLNSLMSSVGGGLQSIGIIDKGTETLVTIRDLALTKAGLVFMLIGAIIGGMLNDIIFKK